MDVILSIRASIKASRALQIHIRSPEHREQHAGDRAHHDRTGEASMYSPQRLDNFLWDQSQGDSSTILDDPHFWVMHTFALCNKCVSDRTMVSAALRLCKLKPLNVTADIAMALQAPSTLYPVKDSVHLRSACLGGNYIPIVLETPPTANSSTALLLRDRTFMFWLRFGMTILPLTVVLWSAIRRGSEPLFHRVKRLLIPFMAG